MPRSISNKSFLRHPAIVVVGAFNHLLFLEEVRSFFVQYLDILFSLRQLPGGEEFLQKTFEQIKNNKEMKDFIFHGPEAKEISTPYFKERLNELEKFLESGED